MRILLWMKNPIQLHHYINETEYVSQEKLLDIKSGANHGLTLREGQENYKKYGACEKDMKKHVRKPRKSEFSTE